MRHDLELAYLGIEVPAPDTLRAFFADVIGLVPGEPLVAPVDAGAPLEAGATTWRNDDKAHRIIVTPGAANDAAFIGFEATNVAAFESVVERLRVAGFAVTEGSDDDRRTRRVIRLARTIAPWRMPLQP